MTTWGGLRHFKHFLPRLLELTINHRDDFLDLAVVFGKLRYAQWKSWPRAEFDATDRFLRAYWEDQLNQHVSQPLSDAIDTVLCAVSGAYDSVQPLLDFWVGNDSIAARNHLAAFVLWNEGELLAKQRLANSFWDRSSRPYAEVIAWLTSDHVYEYLTLSELPPELAPARCQLEAVRQVFRLHAN